MICLGLRIEFRFPPILLLLLLLKAVRRTQAESQPGTCILLHLLMRASAYNKLGFMIVKLM
jgi:hypothetical protein